MAMPGEGEGGPKVDDPEAVRAEWLERLNALASQVKASAEKAQWRTRIVSKPTRDSVLGRFEVPLLLMERNAVQIALNPVSRFVTGSEGGGVELYVVPAYDEFASLYFDEGRWSLYYVDPQAGGPVIREPEALPLTEETITRVLEEMASREP